MADVQQANATIAAHALAKHVRMSPQKARLVIDMIRGKNVNQALAILRYSNKRAALGIEKCVTSAIHEERARSS